MDAKQLRITKPSEEQLAKIERKPIYIILDNVLDTYNIGSIFRLGDAVAAREIILCGGTETPPSSRIHKAAVGTEEWVPWRYAETAVSAIAKLKTAAAHSKEWQNAKLKVVAVEQDRRSASIFNFQFSIFKDCPIAVVVGHETEGVSKEVLDLADVIVEIPMWGVNKSLNVVVSTGIVLYRIVESFTGVDV